MPDPTPQRTHPPRNRRWPLAVSLGATLCFVAMTLALLLDLRNSVETRARDNARNLLKALERDIARNIELLDLSLQAVVDGVARPDVLAADPQHRNMILFDRSAKARGLGALLVYDAAGRVRYDSEADPPRPILPATDREYFRVQQEANQGLFISEPYLSRITGTTVIGLSRRISAPDGRFAGVALGSIQTSYFTALFDQLELGRSAVVSLVRDDGVILVRRQNGEDLAGGSRVTDSDLFKRFRQDGHGTVIGRSPVDGEERLYAFMRVADRPVFVSVGLSQTGLFSEWRDKAALLLTLTLVVSALIVALTLRLMGELGRRSQTEFALERLASELAELSVTDPLTGLGNRRAFDAAIAREMRRQRRTGRPLGLAMIDVDHFKLFNDRYGHQAGDRALRLVADAIRSSAALDGDGAFRLGGEEFAVLLPNMDLPASLEAAEAIRTRLRDAALAHDASPFGVVTASMGVTLVGEEDAADALARADALLYAAKRAGRDRAAGASADAGAAEGEIRRDGMTIVSIGRRRPVRARAA